MVQDLKFKNGPVTTGCWKEPTKGRPPPLPRNAWTNFTFGSDPVCAQELRSCCSKALTNTTCQSLNLSPTRRQMEMGDTPPKIESEHYLINGGGGNSAALSVAVMEDLCHRGAPSVSPNITCHPTLAHSRRWVKFEEQRRRPSGRPCWFSLDSPQRP